MGLEITEKITDNRYDGVMPAPTIHHGDCLEVLRSLPDASVDAVVTDPPYALSFMGKAWDSHDTPIGFQAWCQLWAVECLRVLKPGGHMLAFGGTRTWHRLACAVEDAGFEVRDSIAWMYGSGFPKSRACLKPAHEPIVVARKKPRPGEGLFNIDACRIGSSDGRWPANVILDEDQADALDCQSGEVRSAGLYVRGAVDASGPAAININRQGYTSGQYADKGGASRFFYVAKAPKRERPNVGGAAHPTVKPLALMRWLVRLATPESGTVLDPFAGSGTTIEAAMLEGFSAVGIEREAEYLPLIRHRIARATPNDLFSGGESA